MPIMYYVLSAEFWDRNKLVNKIPDLMEPKI